MSTKPKNKPSKVEIMWFSKSSTEELNWHNFHFSNWMVSQIKTTFYRILGIFRTTRVIRRAENN